MGLLILPMTRICENVDLSSDADVYAARSERTSIFTGCQFSLAIHHFVPELSFDGTRILMRNNGLKRRLLNQTLPDSKCSSHPLTEPYIYGGVVPRDSVIPDYVIPVNVGEL